MNPPKFCPDCGAPLKLESSRIQSGFDIYTGQPKFSENLYLVCSKADVMMFEWLPTITIFDGDVGSGGRWYRPVAGAVHYLQAAEHAGLV